MTPRERIIATLEHKESDRLPIDFGGTDCSSIHVVPYDRLRRLLGIEPRPIRLACLNQMIVDVDVEIQEEFCADAQALYFYPRKWRLWDSPWNLDIEVPDLWRPEVLEDGSWVIRNAEGVIRKKCPADGYYFDISSFVFSEIVSPEEFSNYQKVFDRWDWPWEDDESIEEYASRAKQLYLNTDKAVVASWRMHYLQAGQLMRGYEQFMVDMLINEPLVKALLDKLHEVYIRRAEVFLEALADYIDIVFFTDDLGAQNGPLINPAIYRKFFKPYWAELIAVVKKYNKKVLMHSCGAISEFIPDLIEIGVDAINPVQITADGMDAHRLKKDFGKDISFWGGGVSTQGVLGEADPCEIGEQVKRNVEKFAHGGGYIFTQVHNIQFNVPAENIIAAYKAALEV